MKAKLALQNGTFMEGDLYKIRTLFKLLGVISPEFIKNIWTVKALSLPWTPYMKPPIIEVTCPSHCGHRTDEPNPLQRKITPKLGDKNANLPSILAMQTPGTRVTASYAVLGS